MPLTDPYLNQPVQLTDGVTRFHGIETHGVVVSLERDWSGCILVRFNATQHSRGYLVWPCLPHELSAYAD